MVFTYSGNPPINGKKMSPTKAGFQLSVLVKGSMVPTRISESTATPAVATASKRSAGTRRLLLHTCSPGLACGRLGSRRGTQRRCAPWAALACRECSRFWSWSCDDGGMAPTHVPRWHRRCYRCGATRHSSQASCSVPRCVCRQAIALSPGWNVLPVRIKSLCLLLLGSLVPNVKDTEQD